MYAQRAPSAALTAYNPPVRLRPGAEQRLRNMFQYPKKRPPVWVMALALLAVLSCGGLVSCEAQAEPEPEPVPIPLVDWTVAEYQIQATVLADMPPEEFALLSDLPAEELPTQPLSLDNLMGEDVWRDILIPVADNREHDVTLYLAVDSRYPAQVWPRIAMLSQNLTVYGIVLRAGDRAAYYPLLVDVWYGWNPSLWVDDFDGDGAPEAAVSLFWGRGVGVHAESLSLFELDTLEYMPVSLAPDLTIAYDQTANTALLTSGDQSLSVDLSDFPETLERVAMGNQVRFDYSPQEGRLYCELGLDFNGHTLWYGAWARCPVLYEDGFYQLGPAHFSLEGPD